jgi:multidrug resistance efflux pump
MEEKNKKNAEKSGSSLKDKLKTNRWLSNLLIMLGLVAVMGGGIFWYISSLSVYIDKSLVSAPIIDLASHSGGILQQVYVQEGDSVSANALIAQVGNELIKSKIAGNIISVNKDIGGLINPGQTIVSMIDPNELRIVGQLDEDKGLSQIKVGDNVSFTVDTFAGKQYQGFVDEISPTSEQSGVVFNISDKRAVQSFDVKIRFDVNAYPELKNGMSAKVWVTIK